MNSPPSSPAAGQCWIVGDAPAGAWAGNAETLACRTESGWRFLPPAEGLQVWLKDQQLWAVRGASSWTVGEVRGERLIIEGQQAVGARLAAIATPTGGGTIDVEARAALISIIDRLAAHGLIDT